MPGVFSKPTNGKDDDGNKRPYQHNKSTANKKTKVVLDSSSDEEGLPEVKNPSPFASRALERSSGTPSKNKNMANTKVTLYLIQPAYDGERRPLGNKPGNPIPTGDGLYGIAFSFSGPQEWNATQIFFDRTKYENYVLECGVVPHCFQLYQDGKLVKAKNNYFTRLVIFDCYGNQQKCTEKIARETLDAWLGQTQKCNHEFKIDFIHMEKIEVKQVRYWSQILGDTQFTTFINRALPNVYGDLPTFLKSDLANVYSFWAPGEVPEKIITSNKIKPAKYLLPIDAARITAGRANLVNKLNNAANDKEAATPEKNQEVILIETTTPSNETVSSVSANSGVNSEASTPFKTPPIKTEKKGGSNIQTRSRSSTKTQNVKVRTVTDNNAEEQEEHSESEGNSDDEDNSKDNTPTNASEDEN